jgi:uncharacterized protein YajQ (UPF0234 family)
MIYTVIMANFSFDVVSDYDKAEMNNVFDQTKREIESRFDFKGTPADVNWLEDKKGLKVTGASAWQVDTILDIVRKKLAARNIDQAVLDTSHDTIEANLQASKEVPFKQGINQETAKKISKLIRETNPKVKTQIQGNMIRVTAGSKDDLQEIIRLLNTNDFDLPLNFINYR